MKLAKGGYAGVTLRVDLTSGIVHREPLDENLALTYVGGRGFTSRLQYDLIPSIVDPLGPDNVVILATGPLTGTTAPASGRFTIGGRSPLTGVLGDANSGGFWGAALKRAGYDFVTVHGQSQDPVYLWIDNDSVQLRDARHLWGKNTRETRATIKQETGKGVRIASIGQAGENRVHIAGLMNDTDRAAARTGLGAVLGSKKLKAIAVRGTQEVLLHDRVAFEELSKRLFKILRTDTRSGIELQKYGTSALLDHHYPIGMTGARNFQSVVYKDSAIFGHEDKLKIDGDALNAEYLVRNDACYRCPCKCGRITHVRQGRFAGEEGGGPEYSTLGAFGPNCGNNNLASILKANELCNLYGLDTIDTGNIIAFAMELYERGILRKADTDGLDLTWGNAQAIVEMVTRIAFRRGFGDILANGIVEAARKIGKNAERYAVHVKGMTPPPPDARAMKVYNFRYAVSPRGADHLRISAPGAYELEALPIMEAAQKLQYWEKIVTIPDLMGVCKFPYSYYSESTTKTIMKMTEILPGLYSSATGLSVTGDDLLLASERVISLERSHNSRLGLTSQQDTLPPRFTEDPLPDAPAKGRVHDMLEPLKETWYMIHGWDEETGVPTRRKLEELGMKDVADDLERHGLTLL